jgi:Carbohydrate-binding module family 5/12/Glycosyl hydrolases family 16
MTSMSPTRTTRRAALAAAALVATAGSAVAIVVAAPASQAAACAVLFDDFYYSAHTDPNLTARGWVPRSYAGGPGVPGANWAPGNVAFPTVNGEKVAQLTSSTDGTSGGTTQSELYQSQQRFFEGTYASRIRFTDAPISGTDGDHIVQTFFTITPLRGDLDPTYSELDISEYLPNGGWGEVGPINYQTTWYTYRNEPWFADNVHSSQRVSMDGWHDLVAQVSAGHVKYYVDGVLVGDHSGKYYPRQPMSINFNLWFIDTAGHTSGLSTYIEQIDWLYFAKDEVVAPADVTARAAGYRAAGTRFVDTVATGTGGACNPPTATTRPPTSTTRPPTSTTRPPTTTTTRPPTTTTRPPTTTTTRPPGWTCATAPAWDWGTVYLEGQRVRHNGHLWQANWWTLGSEPGLTAQWRDLGPC